MSNIGHNQPPAEIVHIPEGKGEGAKYLYNRLVKLNADKRLYSDHVRAAIAAVKNDHGIKPATARTAVKLANMGPEKREKWLNELSPAAELFGISVGLASADMPPRTGPLWNLVLAINLTLEQKKEISAEIKALVAKARERGDIDVDAILFLVRMSRRDRDEQADWFASVDSMGAFLGIW